MSRIDNMIQNLKPKPPVQLGVIEFINTQPIYAAFDAVSAGVTCCLDYPTALNRRMLNGDLTVSPVSSAHYLRHAERYVLLNDLSVSSYGAVDSVLILTHQPLTPQQLAQQPTIAVPHDSETSISVLQALLTPYLEGSTGPQLMTYPAQQYPQALEATGAVLVIGDRALQAQQSKAIQASIIDLAQWWVDSTQLPMVFAVWVAQKEWAEEYPEAFQALNQQLIQAKHRFREDTPLFEKTLSATCQVTGLPAEAVEKYWTQSLNYDLTAEHMASLDHLGKLLSRHSAPETMRPASTLSTNALRTGAQSLAGKA